MLQQKILLQKHLQSNSQQEIKQGQLKEQVIIDEDKKQEEEKEPTPDKDDLNDDNPEQ